MLKVGSIDAMTWVKGGLAIYMLIFQIPSLFILFMFGPLGVATLLTMASLGSLALPAYLVATFVAGILLVITGWATVVLLGWVDEFMAGLGYKTSFQAFFYRIFSVLFGPVKSLMGSTQIMEGVTQVASSAPVNIKSGVRKTMRLPKGKNWRS